MVVVGVRARLRTEAGRHLFTVKVPGDNELSCEEHETEVADRDQMHAAVEAKGFTPTVTYSSRLGCVTSSLVAAYLTSVAGNSPAKRYCLG